MALDIDRVPEAWWPVGPRIVGNLDNWTTVYDRADEFRITRAAALRYGEKFFGSDDFLVAKVERGVLTLLAWYDRDRDDEDERHAAAADLGLKPA